MQDCHARRKYILAGSIRDDGPLPETMMDLIAAQDATVKPRRREVVVGVVVDAA
jgi:hypothetical protein